MHTPFDDGEAISGHIAGTFDNHLTHVFPLSVAGLPNPSFGLFLRRTNEEKHQGFALNRQGSDRTSKLHTPRDRSTFPSCHCEFVRGTAEEATKSRCGRGWRKSRIYGQREACCSQRELVEADLGVGEDQIPNG